MLTTFAKRVRTIVDQWDEVGAAADDHNKVVGPFAVGASLAFPDLSPTAGLQTLASAVRKTLIKPDAFYSPQQTTYRHVVNEPSWLSFPSPITTEDAGNNTVFARVFERHRRKDAVLLVPHWNAKADALFSLAGLLDKIGFTAIVLVLPYHHQRKRPLSTIADYFLSANLGRTIRSVRQAVVDLRGVIDCLEDRGYRRFYTVGTSLGSCIAGLVGAFDPRVRASILLLTAGSFADVVWTGRATHHISAALQPALSLDQLREIWSIISLDTYAHRFRNPSHQLQVLSAARDQVVLPEYTADFIDTLRNAEVIFRHISFPCGHYSLAKLPFNIWAAARMVSFLRDVSR